MKSVGQIFRQQEMSGKRVESNYCIKVEEQAGILYSDDVCLMASREEDMKVIMEKVNECVVEYGLKVNEKKFKVVCINGKVGRRRWMMGDCCIGEVEEYKYLGINSRKRKACWF